MVARESMEVEAEAAFRLAVPPVLHGYQAVAMTLGDPEMLRHYEADLLGKKSRAFHRHTSAAFVLSFDALETEDRDRTPRR